MGLARAVLLLLAGAALLLAAARFGGLIMGRADDPRALIIADCAAHPCLFGVIPGSTTWADAQTALAAYAPQEADAKRIVVRLPGASVETYRSVDAQRVGRMYYNFREFAPLSAGWIIQRFGVPCGVSIYANGELMTLRYPLLLANIQVRDGHFDLHAPVRAIHLSDPAFFFESQPDPCVDNITTRQMVNTRWQGFAPTAIYWQRAGAG